MVIFIYGSQRAGCRFPLYPQLASRRKFGLQNGRYPLADEVCLTGSLKVECQYKEREDGAWKLCQDICLVHFATRCTFLLWITEADTFPTNTINRKTIFAFIFLEFFSFPYFNTDLSTHFIHTVENRKDYGNIRCCHVLKTL